MSGLIQTPTHQSRIVRRIAVGSEHVILLPPWPLPGKGVDVCPDDFAIPCDLKEGTAWAITDEGIPVWESLGAGKIGGVEILRILGRIDPQWL